MEAYARFHDQASASDKSTSSEHHEISCQSFCGLNAEAVQGRIFFCVQTCTTQGVHKGINRKFHVQADYQCRSVVASDHM